MTTRDAILDGALEVMRTRGLARTTTKEIARAAGFSEHLTKPINFDRLDEAIQMLLSEPEPAVRS